MVRRALALGLATVLLAGLGLRLAGLGSPREVAPVFGQAAVRAPELPRDARWFNTERPVQLSELRGKVVLLDFWTYCCINCMHILPELAKLESKYRNELVVVGVHSAKFAEEGDPARIREAILRYGIEHPVVADTGMRVWNQYAVHAWPTIVLIDPRGQVVFHRGGEITAEAFAPLVDELIRRAGTGLDRTPRTWALERERQPASLLSFPGKVVADEAGGRLVIADSGHHRYLLTSLDGRVQRVIGSGQEGLRDGSFATARFTRPQGAALVGDQLYLADTGNHALRVADLTTGQVRTLVGNGRKPARYGQGGSGTAVSLHSPWDVVAADGRLYVANAGSHQIWLVDPATAEAQPFAGSGREDLADGPRSSAALAQTSGLLLHDGALLFADSETSSIRSTGLAPDSEVTTLVGHGLFDFGDVDGGPETARLQHCLGLTWAGGAVLVADTYNHKLRRVDPVTHAVTTFAGTGRAGQTDGPLRQAQFNEPGGLSVAGGKLYVADTNNHTIRVVDLAAGTVSTLALRELERVAPLPGSSGRRVTVPPVTLAAGAATLELRLTPAAGYHLNPLAPLFVKVGDGARQQFDSPRSPVKLPLTLAPGQTSLVVEVDAYFCRTDGAGACLLDSARFEVPLRPGGTSATLGLELAQRQAG